MLGRKAIFSCFSKCNKNCFKRSFQFNIKFYVAPKVAKPHKICTINQLTQNDWFILQEAFSYRNNTSEIEDMINYAFGCMSADNCVYSRAAHELFTYAKEFDSNKVYKNIIECGLKQSIDANSKIPHGFDYKTRLFGVIDNHDY